MLGTLARFLLKQEFLLDVQIKLILDITKSILEYTERTQSYIEKMTMILEEFSTIATVKIEVKPSLKIQL